MLILTLISIQYLQNVAFSFEKGLTGQNHSLSESCHPIDPPPLPPRQISHPLPVNTIWKTLGKGPSLLKLVCLFQVKFNFSIDIFFQSSIMT